MKSAQRWFRRDLVLVSVQLTLLVLACTVPRIALAHARLVRSNPGKQAQLSAAPQQVELWFNELLDDGFNSIEVFPVAELGATRRTNLTGGEVKLDPKDATHLSVPVQSLPPGEYVVEWSVLSRDGHSAPGRLNFRVLDLK